MTLRPIVIFDLDNCLSDDSARIGLAQSADDWAAYHAVAPSDPPANRALFAAALKAGCHFFFITARPERYRLPTQAWLEHNFGVLVRGSAKFPDGHRLLMRPHWNKTKSQQLKPWLFELTGRAWTDVAAAYDDREDVLDAYVERGVQYTARLLARSLGALNDGSPFVPDLLEAIERWREGSRSAPPLSESLREVGDSLAALSDAFRDVHAVPPRPPNTAADLLRSMAETYQERNKTYGDNFRRVGPVMCTLFPDGVSAETLGGDNFHLLELMIVKLTRFAITDLQHTDSIHDAGVYAAMIESNLQEQQQENDDA